MSDKDDKANAVDGKSEPNLSAATSVRRASASVREARTWAEWTRELGVDKALARGACADIRSDWSAPIERGDFDRAVKQFGKTRHG